MNYLLCEGFMLEESCALHVEEDRKDCPGDRAKEMEGDEGC
jgi:hypothetical protein